MIAVVVVAILAVVDVVGTPKPSTGACIFQDRLVLPDICVSGCPGCATCPTARTRRCLFFWTEAAGCPDVCICGASGRNHLNADCDPQRGVPRVSTLEEAS